MKKKILVTFTAVVVTAFAGYGVSKSMNNSNTQFSDLALANVEALADSESGCVNKPDMNDGDCTSDGSTYFCENSWMFHDCVKGKYF